MSNEIPTPEERGKRTPMDRHYQRRERDGCARDIFQKNSPEQPEQGSYLPLAQAIMHRDRNEQQWRRTVLATQTEIPLPEEEITGRHAQTDEEQHLALFLNNIAKSKSPDTDMMFLRDYFADLDEIRIRHGLPPEIQESEDFEDIRRLTRRKLKLQTQLGGESSIGLPLILGSNELAAEQGIAQTEVFKQDDLYEELMRRRYDTPEAFAESQFMQIGQITPGVLIQIAETDLILDQLLSRRPLEGTHRKIQSLMDEESTKLLIDEQARLLKEMRTIVTRESIKRFWGEEAFDELPPAIQNSLGTTPY